MFNTRPIQDICPESLRNKLCESHKNKKLCPNRTARKDIEFFIVTNTLAYFVKKQNLHFGVKCKISCPWKSSIDYNFGHLERENIKNTA